MIHSSTMKKPGAEKHAPPQYRARCSRCRKARLLDDAELLQARSFGGLLSRCCHVPTKVERVETKAVSRGEEESGVKQC